MEQWERDFLRDMAKEKLELSLSDDMRSKARGWTALNNRTGNKPMIHFEMGTVGDAGFNYQCKCQSGDARSIEWSMGSEMANYKMVGDDRVVSGYFSIGNSFGMKPFNLDPKSTHAEGVGFHIDPIVDDLDTLDFIQPSPMWFDSTRAEEWAGQVNDVIGDILPVRRAMGGLYVCLTSFIVRIMGMENMFVAMYDNPDNFKEMMDRLSDDYVAMLKEAESRGLLLENNGNDWIAQGSFGFTDDLPGKLERPHKLNEVWGFMDSQETVDISPEMFDEFIFPAYKKVSSLYGLLSYGCCEPVHSFWAKSLSQMKNLRKISISPWCDEEYMGEELRKANVIFQRKPSPLFIGAAETFDEAGWRKHVEKTMRAARGGRLEFTFRDIYKINGDLNRPRRAVEIVRDVIEKEWY